MGEGNPKLALRIHVDVPQLQPIFVESWIFDTIEGLSGSEITRGIIELDKAMYLESMLPIAVNVAEKS